MTQRVLLLTGTCGVGKSSVAQEWAQRHESAVIAGDAITDFVAHAPFEPYTGDEQKLVGELAAEAATEFVQRGMSVVVEWVLYPGTIRRLRNRLRKRMKRRDKSLQVCAVWLTADRLTNHQRDKSREASVWMNERVDIVADELEQLRWPRYVHRLDTSNLDVNATVDRIDALCW